MLNLSFFFYNVRRCYLEALFFSLVFSEIVAWDMLPFSPFFFTQALFFTTVHNVGCRRTCLPLPCDAA